MEVIRLKNKGEYEIEVREVLSEIIRVNADTLGDALEQVMDRYKRGEIVLDAENFVDVDYIPLETKR